MKKTIILCNYTLQLTIINGLEWMWMCK